MSYQNGLVVCPAVFYLSLDFARSSWSEPQSAPGLVFTEMGTPYLNPEKPICRSGSNRKQARKQVRKQQEAGQEVRTGHGTTDWFQIGKGVRQGCILSPCLFNFYAEFSSVAQSCPTLCDPTDYSTPGLLVHHQLPEFTQTHVH